MVSTDVLTIGVPVGGKISFEAVMFPDPVNPGSKATLEVAYRNTGLSDVYGAQARLYTIDPSPAAMTCRIWVIWCRGRQKLPALR